MKKNTLLCAFALLLTLFACKKENEPSPQQRILGVWKLSSIQFTIGNTTEEEVLEECSRNFTYEFKEGGVILNNDACNDDINMATYSLSADGKVITITFPDGPVDIVLVYNIEELSATTLRLSASFEEEGVTLRETFTFTRQ